MRNRRALALFISAVLLFGAACSNEEEPAPGNEVAETPEPDPICPLSGAEGTTEELERPAIAVKIENSPAAYPLSGLDDAEVVYEELVEGGLTRFMALYHCNDTAKAGPVRSARIVDPPIMAPYTRILGAAGGNAIVRKALDKAKIVTVDEDTPGGALRRIDRPGITSEHTLYGNTEKIRKVGAKKYSDPPAAGLFKFGELPSGGRTAKSVTLFFSQADPIVYSWKGGAWERTQHGEPFEVEGGRIAVDNVIIELHKVVYSKKLFDSAGNPSIEIVDPVGSGDALVFRDGQVFEVTWSRKAETDRVVYETKDGEEMALAEGTTWVALLPNNKGQVKGSFEIRPSGGSGKKSKGDG